MSYAESKVVIDLTEGITWEKVFDAGFRPQYIRDGKFGCRQFNVRVVITTKEFPEGIDLGSGDVQFSLKENNLVIGFSFFGRENRSLVEAREKSMTFAKMFGDDTTKQAKFNVFQVKHEVDYSGRKLNPPEVEEHIDLETTTNAAKVGDFSIIYSFGDSYRNDLPLVERLSVALKSQEAKRAKRLTEKIRPPEGYEHVSLESGQGDPTLESESPTPDVVHVDKQAHAVSFNRNSVDPEDRVATEVINRLPWVIIGGLLLLGTLIFLVLVSLRGRSL